MNSKVVAIIAGALVTISLWAIAFVILNGVYDGNFPWLLSVLIVFLCPLIGGYVTARLERSNGARMGAYSGLVAGLIVLLTSAIVSNLSPNTTLLGVFIAILGVLGGGLGAYLRRGGQQTS